MAKQSESKNTRSTSRSSNTTRSCTSKLESASDCSRSGKNCRTKKASKKSK